MYFIRMGFQLIVVVAVNVRVQVNAYVIRFIKGSYARIARYVSLLCICYSTCFPRPSPVSSRFICNEKVFSLSVCIFSAIGRKHDIVYHRHLITNKPSLPTHEQSVPTLYPSLSLCVPHAVLLYSYHNGRRCVTVLAHIVML